MLPEAGIIERKSEHVLRNIIGLHHAQWILDVSQIMQNSITAALLYNHQRSQHEPSTRLASTLLLYCWLVVVGDCII